MLRQIDLNRIQDFIVIVDQGNITRAAEALGDRKAKLSRNLALLESELGVLLVHRTTRQFQLTDAGRLLYQQAKQNFAQLEDGLRGLMNQVSEIQGNIKITAPEDFGNQIITPIVSEFKKLHSRVQFEIYYTNQVLDLVKSGVDVAFRMGHLKDSTLIHKKVGNLEFILAASTQFVEKWGQPRSPEDLLKVPSIGFASQESMQWQLHSGQQRKKLTLKPDLRANSYIAVRDFCLLGQGVAYLPRFLCEDFLKQDLLVHILKNWKSEGAPVQVVMHNQKNIPQRIRSFFDFATQQIDKLL